MSSVNPAVSNVEADPKRPWKALGAALATAVLVALRDYFAAGNAINWAGLLAALGSAVVTFLVTYLIRNPKVPATPDPNRRAGGPL